MRMKFPRSTRWFFLGFTTLALGLAGACGGGETTSGTKSETTSANGGNGGNAPSGTGGSGGGTSAKTACTDYAAAKCMKFGSCSNGYQIAVRYGDEMTCEFRVEQACEAALLAADSGETGDDIEACTAALKTQACPDFFSNGVPDACKPKPGTRAADASCGTPYQCKSGWCELGPLKTCGTCIDVPLAGSSCADDTDCGPGLVCFKNECESPGQNGAACDKKTKPCGAGQNCIGATDDAAGTCQKAVDMVGTDCDATGMTGPGCNATLGLYCHPSLKKCERVLTVDAGQPCGAVKNHLTVCKDAGRCNIAAMMSMGTCEAAAGDTMPCNAKTGPFCQPPATCVVDADAGGAGTCTFPDPNVCTN
jgi:hypothetical protein